MDFYGTEICFKTMFKVLKFLKKFEFLQKFLLNYLSWLKCISDSKHQFSKGAVWGSRNFWDAKLGKCGQLSPIQPKWKKKSSNVEKWWFWSFLKKNNFLKFFDPQLQIFKNTPRTAEFSEIVKIIRNVENKAKRIF